MWCVTPPSGARETCGSWSIPPAAPHSTHIAWSTMLSPDLGELCAVHPLDMPNYINVPIKKLRACTWRTRPQIKRTHTDWLHLKRTTRARRHTALTHPWVTRKTILSASMHATTKRDGDIIPCRIKTQFPQRQPYCSRGDMCGTNIVCGCGERPDYASMNDALYLT